MLAIPVPQGTSHTLHPSYLEICSLLSIILPCVCVFFCVFFLRPIANLCFQKCCTVTIAVLMAGEMRVEKWIPYFHATEMNSCHDACLSLAGLHVFVHALHLYCLYSKDKR